MSERIDYTIRPTAVGFVLVAVSDRGICAILMGDEAGPLVSELAGRFPEAAAADDIGELERTVDRVVTGLDLPGRGIDAPLDLCGTRFQERVWHALRQIPPGTTATYAEVAERIGARGAARAVAQACRANMLALAVPCHRVIRTDGAISGYRWGVDRKRYLLAREAA